MEGNEWPTWTDQWRRAKGSSAPDQLVQVAHLTVPLDEALLILRRYQEEQEREAADLLERESWALDMLLARSAPVWQHIAQPTVHFDLAHPGESAASRLEVGCFTHLANLATPSEQEQALQQAPGPCWARVTDHPGRRLAGYQGALACAYIPISTAEAVTLLGSRRILSQLEEATRAAGRKLAAQAERRACVLALEQMLKMDPKPTATTACRPGLVARWLAALMQTSVHTWLVVASVYFVSVLLLCAVLIAAS